MEILISVIDHNSDIDSIKMGEVIDIHPDGWVWTQAELTDSHWRIISAPILNTAAETILQSYIDPSLQVSGVKYKRKKYLADFSLLPIPAKFQGVRTQQIITLTKAQVLAAMKAVT